MARVATADERRAIEQLRTRAVDFEYAAATSKAVQISLRTYSAIGNVIALLDEAYPPYWIAD